MDGNEIIADFIGNVSWNDLPEEVHQKVKLCLLDTLGATIGGTLTPVSKITASYIAKVWPGNEATVLLYSASSSAAGAALANGYAANALDIDDDAKYTQGHPGAQIFPVSLAVSEKVDANGKEMLTAMVVGYEVAHRVGRCWHDYHKVYQACGSWGSVANAAITAKLIGLSKKEIKNALGIAEYHAPNLPMMRDIDTPTMVKHGIGWGAATGVISAELAAQGFTGIPSILGFKKYQDWASDIGENYIMVDGVHFKKYPSCKWGHPVFAAALKLMHEHNIKVSDIAKIVVKGFHETVCLQIKRPQTEEEAQFSVAWPLAALLIDGELGPKQMLSHRYNDKRILSLVNKIELVESKEVDAFYRPIRENREEDPNACWSAAVRITLKNGQSFYSGITKYEELWDEEELKKRFRWITSYVIDNERVEKLLDIVQNFENLSSVNKLTNLLRTP